VFTGASSAKYASRFQAGRAAAAVVMPARYKNWTELRLCPLLHLSRPDMPVSNVRFVPEADIETVIQGNSPPKVCQNYHFDFWPFWGGMGKSPCQQNSQRLFFTLKKKNNILTTSAPDFGMHRSGLCF